MGERGGGGEEGGMVKGKGKMGGIAVNYRIIFFLSKSSKKERAKKVLLMAPYMKVFFFKALNRDMEN